MMIPIIPFFHFSKTLGLSPTGLGVPPESGVPPYGPWIINIFDDFLYFDDFFLSSICVSFVVVLLLVFCFLGFFIDFPARALGCPPGPFEIHRKTNKNIIFWSDIVKSGR